MKGYENDQKICKVIRCYYEGNCNIDYLLNAMDGTTCSNGAWCRKGNCVLDSRAPKAPSKRN